MGPKHPLTSTSWQLSASSRWPIHLPCCPFTLLGLKQLWSKVDTTPPPPPGLSSMEPPLGPNPCAEDPLPRHGNSQLLTRLGLCCVQMDSRGQQRVTFQLRTKGWQSKNSHPTMEAPEYYYKGSGLAVLRHLGRFPQWEEGEQNSPK